MQFYLLTPVTDIVDYIEIMADTYYQFKVYVYQNSVCIL